jgi:uncharacterized protein (TIGR03067 family)
MRSLCLLIAALLVVPLAGSNSPKEYDDRTEMDSLEGSWRMVAINDEGKDRTPSVERCIKTFRGGKWSYSENGRPSTAGTYTTDKKRMPGILDESYELNPGRTRKCIYRIERDTLRIAFRLRNDGVRPTNFDENGLYIMTWKRLPR